MTNSQDERTTLKSLWETNGSPKSTTLFYLPNGEIVSYAHAYEISDVFSDTIESIGIKPGDRVAAILDKSHFAIIVYMACVRYGAIYCPMNVDSTQPEFAYLIEHVRPALIVCRGESAGKLHAAALKTPVLTFEADGTGSFFSIARPAPSGSTVHTEPEPGDGAVIMYTSGTTGKPKAALMSQHNLATNATALREAWEFSSDDVLMHILPIHHTHGLLVAMNVALAAGAGVMFLPHFDETLVKTFLPRCTAMMGVPTHYTRLLRHSALDRDTVAHMRLFVSGSAPLPVPVIEEFEERTGHRLIERYGMTEVGIISSTRLSEPAWRGSVGRPLRGVEVRLAEAPESDIGRVEVRGPGVFGGYWSSEGCDRSEFTADGFFVTGDLGKLDDAGNLILLGREKDIVITGGLNVYPAEVEQEIRAIGGVEDAAVVGIAHADFGEAVVAFAVLQPGSALTDLAISSKLREVLSSYKRPKKIVFLDELPRNAMGKVDKKMLRATFAGLFSATWDGNPAPSA